MIRSRKPERFVPAHAVKAHEDILQGVFERMSYMQCPRNVRRRHDNAEKLHVRVLGPWQIIRIEVAGIFPLLVDPLFHFLWVVARFKLAFKFGHEVYYALYI